MKSATGKDLARAAEAAGWQLLRIHGSHHIYGRPGTIVRLSSPMHRNHPLKAGLLRHLMTLAGLTEQDL